MKHPKLRDSKRLLTREPYPINEIPESIIKLIGKRFVYMLCVGYKDLTGDDWGNVFAKCIGGEHLQSPVGIADVVYDKMAWSMKTVKTHLSCQNLQRSFSFTLRYLPKRTASSDYANYS